MKGRPHFHHHDVPGSSIATEYSLGDLSGGGRSRDRALAKVGHEERRPGWNDQKSEKQQQSLKDNHIEDDRDEASVRALKALAPQNRGMKQDQAFIREFKSTCADLLATRDISSPAARRQFIETLAGLVEEKLAPNSKPSAARHAAGASPVPLAEPVLPDGAPRGQTWKTHRKIHETPANFISRVYGPKGADWLAKGMSIRQLRKRDRILVTEFYRWRKTNKLPAELEGKLLTVEKCVDRLLDRYAEIHGDGAEASKSLSRLRSAAQRRQGSAR